MTTYPRRHRALITAGLLSLALVVTGCSDGGGDDSGGRDDCAPFADYQGHRDTKVTIYSPIRDQEADWHEQSWEKFVDCTGIDIQYEGTGEFEAQVQVRVDGNRAPDLAFFPQPGLLERFAKAGKVKPAPAAVRDLAERGWSESWRRYGTIDGTFYAAPLGSSVKSYVWYSPGLFKEKGWQVPQTWDQLIALSDTIAASGTKPWCAGIASGDATGWPVTDWMEDVMLREHGVDGYDQWITHRIPFNDPKVASVTDRVGTILKNERYVNGGFGGVKSIATTTFQQAGGPILDRKCALHRQASFYAAQWKSGTTVGADSDVFAFYFPPIDPGKGKPVLVAGEFVAAFTDRPEVQAVQRYLATSQWANSRAALGAWVSANKGVDVNRMPGAIDRLSAQILQDAGAVVRFDGSDQMPGSVGSGTFWKGMTNWINGTDTKATLDFIENSWPK